MSDPITVEPHWYRDYFDDRMVRFYRMRLDPAETRYEVGAIIEMLGLPVGARLLDAGCGWGRHAVPLAEAGMAVTGVDLSRAALEEARRAARAAGVEIHLERRDIREIEWVDAFDGALSLFSSLGYFLSDAEDLRALRAVRRALRPGGVFLLETMHRDALAVGFQARDRWEAPDGMSARAEREFDPVSGILRERLRWVDGDERGEKTHQLRVRCATEWDRLLREAGLNPEQWFGDWDGSPLEPDSDRLLCVSRRG